MGKPSSRRHYRKATTVALAIALPGLAYAAESTDLVDAQANVQADSSEQTSAPKVKSIFRAHAHHHKDKSRNDKSFKADHGRHDRNEDSSTLPTIQVTAAADSLKVDQSANKKYVAPLLDTPKSVAVISQKLIQETNANTLVDALRNEPGITLGAGEGGTPYTDMPYVRGYSSQSSIYIDGVRNATSQNRDMFAIEQVEVTKGSSSAVSGGGGVGGSINLITKVAHEGDVLQGNVGGGTDNYKHIMLDGNKDFGNGVAGRVVVMGHQNNKPGQGSDGAEYSRVGIAPSIALGLGTDNRATLSYYFLKSNDDPDAGIPYNNSTVPANAPAGTLPGNGKPVYVKQGTYYGWKDRDFDRRENHIGTLKLEHDFNDNLTVSNTASYSYSKSDYISSMPDNSAGNIYNGEVWRRNNNSIRDTKAFTDQLSLLGELNTGFIKHNFNVGAEYSHQETNRGTYTATDPIVAATSQDPITGACSLGIGAPSDYWCTSLYSPNSSDPWLGRAIANKKQTTVTSETTSVYALDSLELNKFWLLNLGVRWDKFDTELKYNQDVTSRSSTIKAGTKFESDTDYFSYQTGVVFKPTENGSIYVSYATSANPVGIDQGDGADAIATTPQTNDLKPEEARTYELGTKWDLFDQRANVTAAVFRTEKQNTRIQIDANTSANAGSSKVDGAELGINGNITDKWDVSAGYSYLDSEVTKAAYSAIAQEGKPLPFVAKNSATLWTTYKVLPKLTLGAGAQYRDQVYANTTSPKILPEYTIYNAMAQYNVDKNVNIQLNINNISDKRYFISGHAAHYANEGDGRNAVLAINFKY